jgi:branched-chain amino acid transport system permease protein
MKRIGISGRSLIILLCFAVAFSLPAVLGIYDLHVVMLGLLTAILALSLNFTLGYVGQPNFGHGALFGFGAYASAIVTLKLGVPFGVSFVVAMVVAGVVGFFVGYITLQLRGAYFCMVTIAIGQVFLLLATNFVPLTGGPMGLAGVTSPEIFGIGGDETLWIFAILMLGVMIWLTWMLEKSVVGRAWIAIRESETLSKALGINSFQYAMLAYVIGSIFAGAAGSLYAHYVGFVDPTIFAFSWSSMTVVAVAMGGRGTILGPLIGGLLVTLLPEYLRVASLWRLPMFGLVLILIIVFIPDGLVKLPKYLKEKRNAKLEKALTEKPV